MIYSPDDVKRMLAEIEREVEAKSSHTDPYGESTRIISQPALLAIIDKVRSKL